MKGKDDQGSKILKLRGLHAALPGKRQLEVLYDRILAEDVTWQRYVDRWISENVIISKRGTTTFERLLETITLEDDKKATINCIYEVTDKFLCCVEESDPEVAREEALRRVRRWRFHQLEDDVRVETSQGFRTVGELKNEWRNW